MNIGSLINENISKKLGIGMLAMYLVSRTDNTETAYVIAAIAEAGIVAQGVVDALAARKP